MRGLFISFEGGDGTGKSTQVDLLFQRLSDGGYPVTRTFEPGGTPLGVELRDLLLNSHVHMEPLTEALVFIAARCENVESVVRPALARGEIVLSDRFFHSTLAYQGYGKNLPLSTLSALNDIVLQGLKPDLTILLDLESERSLQRRAGRTGDRIEGHLQLGLDLGDALAGKREGGWEKEVHERIRTGYLTMAAQDPQHWVVLDAAKEIETIEKLIWSLITPYLARCGLPSVLLHGEAAH